MSAVRVPGRLLSWTALTVALGASVAANVASAHPGPGPQLSAGVAPVLTALAVGLIERVELANAQRWQRVVIWAALALIAVFAFVTSYQHQYHLLRRYQNPLVAALVLPLAVDGLIVMASVCLSVVAAQRRRAALPESGDEQALEGAPERALEPVIADPAASARSSGSKRASARKAPSKRRTAAESGALIAGLVEQDPDITTAALAHAVNLSPQRVRALRSANGSHQPATA